ncbi:MAG: twin-arginine translocation signal domain-containing protein [Anaerolineales bacterium]
MSAKFTRRDFLKAGGLTILGAAGINALANSRHEHANKTKVFAAPASQHDGHGGIMPGTVGEVDHEANGFNPDEILTDFDYGEVSTLPNGQTLREYRIIAHNKDIEVVPGIVYPAWVYNGRIPAPRSAPQKATEFGSSSSMEAITRTRCTFTGFTPATWTACPVQVRAETFCPTNHTSMNLMRNRSGFTSIIVTRFLLRVTSPKDSTARSSLIPKAGVRAWIARW